MVIYYIFFMFFGVAASLDNLRQDDRYLKFLKKGIFFSGFLLIIFFVGFRYKLGSDWVSYLKMYEEATDNLSLLFKGDNLSFSSDFTEPGFKILISFCKSFGINYAFFVFFITVFNTFSLFWFLSQNKIRNKLIFLSMTLILTTFYEFDILRQSLSFHIVLFALNGGQVRLRRLVPYVILAMTFHYTAIVFLIFYFFQKLNISRKGILLLCFIYCISLFISIPIITTIIKIIAPLVGGTISAILSKAVTLVEGFGFQRNISPTSLLNLGFLALLALRIKTLVLSPTEVILIKIFLFYIIINILFKEIQEVADRFSYYFNIGIAFMFCLMNDFIRIKERKLLLLPVPLLFVIMRLSIHFRDPGIWYGQTPYRNYFFIDNSGEPEIMKRYDMMQSIKSSENEGKKN
jgi:hypothetical protein